MEQMNRNIFIEELKKFLNENPEFCYTPTKSDEVISLMDYFLENVKITDCATGEQCVLHFTDSFWRIFNGVYGINDNSAPYEAMQGVFAETMQALVAGEGQKEND